LRAPRRLALYKYSSCGDVNGTSAGTLRREGGERGWRLSGYEAIGRLGDRGLNKHHGAEQELRKWSRPIFTTRSLAVLLR